MTRTSMQCNDNRGVSKSTQAIGRTDDTPRGELFSTTGLSIRMSPPLVENIREPLNTAILRYSVQYLADSKEELQTQGKVYRLEFYSLSFRYSQSQESNDHHYTSVEKRLLEKEVLLRPSETRVSKLTASTCRYMAATA